MECSTDARRIKAASFSICLSLDTVLISSETRPPRIKSSRFGVPSLIFFAVLTVRPFASKNLAVPEVACRLKPKAAKSRMIGSASALSGSASVTRSAAPLPPAGTSMPDATMALYKAREKSVSMPKISPVDFISGPKLMSTSVSFENENTGAFTAMFGWSGCRPLA